MRKRTLLVFGLLAAFGLGLVSCAQQGTEDTSSAAIGPGGIGTATESSVSGVGSAPLGGGTGLNVPSGGN